MTEYSAQIMGISLNERNFQRFLLLFQVVFWILFFLLASSTQPAQLSRIGPFWFALTHVPIMMAAVYINYLWLIPRFLARKHYSLYFLILLLLIVLFQMIRLGMERYLFREDQLVSKQFFIGAALSLIILTGSTLFKFVEEWFTISQQQVLLQNQRLRSELQFLRAQVNPHFLFNTLNNLYTLTLTCDERAPQMVARLSEQMRYLIYDGRTTRVKLLRELDLMRSYVELQQLQYDREKNVDLYFEGIRNQHQIAPLLLINFLENSFKHGDLATNPHGWIAVSAVVDGEQLHISFGNSIGPQSNGPKENNGIGLENARRQLELNYPGRYQLNIERREGEFRVDLKIQLEDSDVSLRAVDSSQTSSL